MGDEKLVFETSENITVVPTFDAMGLKEDLLRGIYAYSMHSFIHSFVIIENSEILNLTN